MRSALAGLLESLITPERAKAVQRYLGHLDLAIERSLFDAEDRRMAREEDCQGIGFSRRGADLA